MIEKEELIESLNLSRVINFPPQRTGKLPVRPEALALAQVALFEEDIVEAIALAEESAEIDKLEIEEY